MSRLSYDSVDVLIYDPMPSNRTATRATLYALGFRHTETVSTLEAFIESVHKNSPDIALCEAQGAADELCGAIQQMREGVASHNPFIVIIVTAWDKSSALINKVVSSGADDLILRPFSPAKLGSASWPISIAARVSSSPPIMSAPTAARTARAPPMSNCSTHQIR